MVTKTKIKKEIHYRCKKCGSSATKSTGKKLGKLEKNEYELRSNTCPVREDKQKHSFSNGIYHPK